MEITSDCSVCGGVDVRKFVLYGGGRKVVAVCPVCDRGKKADDS